MRIGMPEWLIEKYAIAQSEGRTETAECKRIFCCAYREYDEKKGATGGPGGVLHMQQELMGNRVKAIRVQYIYRTADDVVLETVEKELSSFTAKGERVITSAGFIASHKEIAASIDRQEHPVLVCHDLGCAYGAYLLGLRYILVYHQQGSILAEIESAGAAYSDEEAELITRIEKTVIDHAVKMYFPSNGAKEEFLKTVHWQLNDEERGILSDEPLYNTIMEKKTFLDDTALFHKLGISFHEEEEVFISVGDFNADKGIDLVPEFLKEYQEKSKRKIMWIAVGNGVNGQIQTAAEEKCNRYGIKHYLISHRIPHDELLTLLDRSKYFIMLHRKSIFDLAVLEAMYHRKIVILSDCTANKEFNVLDNIVIVGEDYGKAAEEVLALNLEELSYKNRLAFSAYFGNSVFAERYAKAVKNLLYRQGMYRNDQSKVNSKFLSEWKNKYRGRKCVICGAGQSLDYLKIQEEDTIYIALNKAVFYPNIHFDMLFMQEAPANQSWVLEDYNAYDCIKFYGIITNRYVHCIGLGDENTAYENVKNRIVRYELAPNTYDKRTDEMLTDCGCNYICDAQSVLFSALQIAVYMGFSKIALCGVEFSNRNYGGTVNASVYSVNVYENLRAAMKE
ncbi:MAG: glycosyltransferase [Lachnospiraceae bacterium]|nr:glycosyltransferase [Lachnospiraceae bacterium]